MTERKSSHTAAGVAALRAAHQVLDGSPRILEDPIALRLLDGGALERIRDQPEIYQTPGARGLRSHVALRSRYAEDCLVDSARHGTDQYVILGAGLDTFAYRQPAWAASLRIFEVDHPASQRAKRERLTEAGIELPANLEFAPIDFELHSLAEGLSSSGFNPARPAFFSWLGVTMYLTEEAILAVFRFVAALPKGSGLVFTFAQPEPPKEEGRTSLAEMAAALGEPWITRFTPQQVESSLLDCGFSSVAFLTPQESFQRYYEGSGHGLPPPRRVNTALARV